MKLYCINLKSFFKQNQDKIVLCAGVVLITVIAFGLGRLSYNIGAKPEPIEILDSDLFKAGAGETLLENLGREQEGIFVGSRNSDKYHLPDCQWAKRIKKENEIWFKSEKEAQEKGYKPSSCIPQK
ncbi:MAG: hypothetical protein COX44_00435 [Candidatus Portnoybacteria bacterium CG23_combo_of_CG06-09_8_20_14_all_37_13]|uniref:Ada DNA repair metal-binding domain-containing protein n=1 Tax=Candidatus Portnoybacteria bacterium CG23_combo_of_CG06-09_8_20_14_all_37_13 TaxID=1974819 RepID=A0A2G9YFQ1_9BACT|nr:MAG: hypothetical protein COX44_00435 [Candidatus Portnoybacteria bacterium CG23_combo_of_CG06-09_8_20_14_all_37_13]